MQTSETQDRLLPLLEEDIRCKRCIFGDWSTLASHSAGAQSLCHHSGLTNMAAPGVPADLQASVTSFSDQRPKDLPLCAWEDLLCPLVAVCSTLITQTRVMISTSGPPLQCRTSEGTNKTSETSRVGTLVNLLTFNLRHWTRFMQIHEAYSYKSHTTITQPKIKKYVKRLKRFLLVTSEAQKFNKTEMSLKWTLKERLCREANTRQTFSALLSESSQITDDLWLQPAAPAKKRREEHQLFSECCHLDSGATEHERRLRRRNMVY